MPAQKQKNKMDRLNKILTRILVFLAAIVFLTGIIFSILRSKSKTKDALQDSEKIFLNQAEFKSFSSQKSKDVRASICIKAFTKIGKLRAATKPGKNGKTKIVLITPYIEYSNDQTFYEELDRNLKKMREIILNYFSEQTAEELAKKNEEKINSELLEKLNSILILQKIQRLYFTDFLIL